MVSIESRCITSRRAPRRRLAAAALAACLLACGGAYAASPPREILVVTDINYPPYLFQTDDGELQGILKDKWALWSQRTGIPARVLGMEWIKAQETVQEGAADVIEALSYTEARAKQYEFSPAYAPIEARVFFHRSIGGINDVASMRGFAIGAKEGSACAAWLAERGIDTIRGYPDSEMLVKAAGAGEVRLFCMDTPAAHYYLFKHRLADEFRETPPLYSTQFHWAVKKGRTELRDFVQVGFARVTEDELQGIEARWFGTPLRLQLDERLPYYLGLLAAALTGSYVLLVAWNRSLRSRVSAKTAELSATLMAVQTYADRVRESEERFGQMFRLSPSAILVSSVTQGRVIDVNEALLRIVGRARQDVIGRTGTELGFWKAPEERAGVLEKLHVKDGGVLQFERTIQTPAGQTKETVVTTTLVDLQGEQVLLSMILDVTERRRAERMLEESEGRLAKVIEASPMSIAINGIEDGRFVEANPAFEKLWGYTRDELIGRTPLELGFWPVPEDRERFIAELQRDGVVYGREFRLRRKDGELRDILGSTALIDLKGSTFSLFQSLDITERKQAERMLEESERRLAKVIEASPEAITIVSTDDDSFIQVNPAGERLCGYTREEMIGRSAEELELWADPEERWRLVEDLQRESEVHGREVHLRHKSGEVRDILLSAALIDLKGRKFILFQAIDITEQKAAEKALREQELVLRELSAHHDAVREGERARIAREVHDELGQALTALKMELSVVAMKGAPQVKETVQALKARVDSIIQTVRDVATALRPAALDLGLLPGVEWLVGEFRRRTGIRCTVSLAGNNIVLPEDRSIVLFRILQESLTNISRHARAHKVEILLDHDAERIRMDVQDDGVGFDVDEARGRKTFGLLGMRERAIMLRGEMRITSAPGHGTRVSVSMPIA
jgi:PAS domain S-box-containing protein